MGSRSHSYQKHGTDSAAAKVSPVWRTRGFAPQPQPVAEHALPDLQAMIDHARRYGHSLSKCMAPPSAPPPIQAKLTVGAPDDQYEQEADRVADQVMSVPDAATQPPIQREAMPEEEELQTKASGNSDIQREDNLEEELQMKPGEPASIQREDNLEEEEIQTKPVAGTLQREAMPEEEELQTKSLGNVQREEVSEQEEVLQAKLLDDIQRSGKGYISATTSSDKPEIQAQTSGDPNFTVTEGQLTFDAEGMEGGQFHSRTAHWPGGMSGVTIGRGYDLGSRKGSDVVNDMTNAGVAEDDAKKFALAVGKKGQVAKKYLDQNQGQFPEITPDQQKSLFENEYTKLGKDVQRVSRDKKVVNDYGQLDWASLDPAIRELLVDLRFRGDYTTVTRKIVQPLAVANDLEGLKNVMANRALWKNVPQDRFDRRKDYLEQKLKDQQSQSQGGQIQPASLAVSGESVKTKPSLQYLSDNTSQVGRNLESRLSSSKGGGSPLPQDVKGFMESRFHTDFSPVRVHTDSEAVQMNRDLNAQAFTHKQDVYFGAGKAPGKDALTAHELTHVVQQADYISMKPNLQRTALAVDSEKQALQAEPYASNQRLQDAFDNSPVMAFGEHGKAVALVQQGLIKAGFPMPISTQKPMILEDGTILPDGKFGDETFLTVKRFQTASGKKIDGIVGKQTLGKLDDLAAQIATPPVKPPLGTAKTTSPVATDPMKPQKVMQNELDNEVRLFKNADRVIEWIKSRTSTASSFHFTNSDLFNDKPTMRKLKPVPKTVLDLDPILKMLVDYGTLKPVNEQKSEFSVVVDPETNEPDTKKLVKAGNDVEQFSKKFEERVKKKDPVVETDLMATEWSSDPPQVIAEKQAEEKLNKLKAKFESLSESEKSGPKGKSLEIAIKNSEADLKKKRRYRTFAKSVLILLDRLKGKNSDWKAGTYPNHSWAEFSVDISFPKVAFDKDAKGFWQRDKVSKFFDDLNASAEEDTSVGKFAWSAIYNDDPLAAEINEKYGNGRVINKPHHGPAPDNLHIHLDVRPVNLQKDEVTGYEIKNDRVHLL